MKTKINFYSGLVIMLLNLVSFNTLMAQDFKGTIRGRVIDKESQIPLPGVNVLIIDEEKQQGAITNPEGYFVLESVPIGRLSMQFSFVGYSNVSMNNLYLKSTKELVVNVGMIEQITELDEVVVKARDKKESNNKLAIISSRSFSVEESERYAGSAADVSRMAMNFAGVLTANDNVNDLIIRGNSPNGLLWRMEGIDIPNPNHFGDGGATGGVISMVNNNVMANSDFMTGAFAPEYGDALSGVFDIKLRNGNTNTHEFTGQMAFTGFELGAEGPISRKNKSSYIIHYRYSVPALFSKMNSNGSTGEAIPYYQDLTAKLNFPTKKLGTFSLFGLGGKSSIDIINSEKDSISLETLYDNGDVDIYNKVDMGVVGLNHTIRIGSRSYLKTSLAMDLSRTRNKVDSISMDTWEPVDFYNQDYIKSRFTAKVEFNSKLNVKNFIRVGTSVQNRMFDIIDSVFVIENNRFETMADFQGSSVYIQPYFQWQHKFTDKLVLNTGLHGQYLQFSNDLSIEPRAGISWQFAPKQKISLAYGYHTQPTLLRFYKQQVYLEDGSIVTPNEDLKFVKSHHYVLGYDVNFSESLRLKTEVYYQDIFDAVVGVPSTSFSSLNLSSFGNYDVPDSLTNGGTGTNYGVEFTFEKFMTKGTYMLSTLSLYDSKYKGSDEVLRNTAFNGNYVLNLLAGKEFPLQKLKTKKTKYSFTLDGKLTLAGGKRYTPIDLERSQEANTEIRDYTQAYSQQQDDYFRFDIRLGLKSNKKRYSQEFGLDLMNVTSRENDMNIVYNKSTKDIEKVSQLGFQWSVLWRINF